jgi:predicted nucleic acid-binding Zn ribbon protein
MADKEEKVPCVVCQEPIRQGAKVCMHCDRVQDWTRHLMRWSTLAGAAVAVLSLVSAAFSLRELIPTPANLKVIPIACGSESVELAVSNLGDKPGMLQQVSLRFREDGKLGDKILLLTAVKGEKIIAAHKTNKLEYKWFVADTVASFSGRFMGTKDCAYVISVKTVDFEGVEVQQEVKCPCS